MSIPNIALASTDENSIVEQHTAPNNHTNLVVVVDDNDDGNILIRIVVQSLVLFLYLSKLIIYLLNVTS